MNVTVGSTPQEGGEFPLVQLVGPVPVYTISLYSHLLSRQTPMNVTVGSTLQEGGEFLLAVPNPFVAGEYTCNVADTAPATLCMPQDSPLWRGATVFVDGTEGRYTVYRTRKRG